MQGKREDSITVPFFEPRLALLPFLYAPIAPCPFYPFRPLRQHSFSSALGGGGALRALGHGLLGDEVKVLKVLNPSPPPLLRLSNLTLGYNRHPAVHHLNADILPGSLLAVVGPNGAGKSTLLKGIIGELKPLQGRIETFGLARENIAYLAQQSTLDSSFPITIHDFVAMGLWAQYGAFRRFDAAAQQRIADALAAVGLSGLEKRPIGQLSGGQVQRVRFARVMLQDSPLVLLDEPYGAIDAATVHDLAKLVRRWNEEGRTVISVLHDFEHVRHEYPETLLLARELVARGATAEVLSDENLQRAQHLAKMQGKDSSAPVCHTEHSEAEHSHP